MSDVEMELDRDEFVVTFDAGKATPPDLIDVVRKAGYTSYVVSDGSRSEDVRTSDPESSGQTEDPLFKAALERAQREGRPIVLDFMASWCVPCRRMETETFSEPAVAGLLEQVIFVKVDTDEHPELAEKFGVKGLPDIRFLTSEGKPVRELRDFQDAELFEESLRELLGNRPRSPAAESVLE